MNNKDIPIIILCGGKGMRLLEETEFKPKPRKYWDGNLK